MTASWILFTKHQQWLDTIQVPLVLGTQCIDIHWRWNRCYNDNDCMGSTSLLWTQTPNRMRANNDGTGDRRKGNRLIPLLETVTGDRRSILMADWDLHANPNLTIRNFFYHQGHWLYSTMVWRRNASVCDNPQTSFNTCDMVLPNLCFLTLVNTWRVFLVSCYDQCTACTVEWYLTLSSIVEHSHQDQLDGIAQFCLLVSSTTCGTSQSIDQNSWRGTPFT